MLSVVGSDDLDPKNFFSKPSYFSINESKL
jgi:hypothetical protein